MLGRAQRILATAALVCALAGVVPHALAAPSVQQQEAVLRQRVAEYEAGQQRLSAIEDSTEQIQAELDGLVERQTKLQTRLDQRARSMYRTGPIGLFELLTQSVSFEQFATRWHLLTRMNRQDATDLAELREARSAAAKSARKLLAEQSRAAAELDSLAKSQAQARQELASSREALARYQAQVAAAKRKRAGSTASASSATPVSKKLPKGAAKGEWRTALCSWYGMGAVGHRTANGTRVRADSMIVAHKTLPFGTLIQFSYNGRTAIAEVADRGPYYGAREFDLGPGTARVLGFDGVANVRYRIIGR